MEVGKNMCVTNVLTIGWGEVRASRRVKTSSCLKLFGEARIVESPRRVIRLITTGQFCKGQHRAKGILCISLIDTVLSIQRLPQPQSVAPKCFNILIRWNSVKLGGGCWSGCVNMSPTSQGSSAKQQCFMFYLLLELFCGILLLNICRLCSCRWRVGNSLRSRYRAWLLQGWWPSPTLVHHPIILLSRLS